MKARVTHPPAAGELQEDYRMEASPSPGSPVVVYVDDNVDDRDLLALARRSGVPGFRLVSFGSIGEAYQFITAHAAAALPPPVLVCDYQLDGETALDLLQKLCTNPALHPLTTIVFSDSPEKAEICYAHGADYFLVKPTAGEGMHALIQCLESCLRQSPPDFSGLRQLHNFIDGEDGLRHADPHDGRC